MFFHCLQSSFPLSLWHTGRVSAGGKNRATLCARDRLTDSRRRLAVTSALSRSPTFGDNQSFMNVSCESLKELSGCREAPPSFINMPEVTEVAGETSGSARASSALIDYRRSARGD